MILDFGEEMIFEPLEAKDAGPLIVKGKDKTGGIMNGFRLADLRRAIRRAHADGSPIADVAAERDKRLAVEAIKQA